MVEVSDDNPRPIVADEMLRDRMKRLNEELDSLEASRAQAVAAFRQVVGILVGMGSCRGAGGVGVALAGVKQAAMEDPLEVEALEATGSALRAALVQEEAAVSPDSEEPAGGGAGPHVVLALLEGLRLGEPAFDEHLERSMGEISRHMASGNVRPAMVVLVDLLEHYRQEQGRRWSEAEEALREVLGEVLTTQSTLADGLVTAQDGLAQASQVYASGVTNTMGQMVREISQAQDLASLKVSALERIRGLRDLLKSHRTRERQLLETSQSQVSGLREALESARTRMAQVEEKSRTLAEQAMNDPLTKVLNKRAMSLKMAEELGRTPRGNVSLIVFDIDRFKNINDTYGHQAGDRALQAIAHQASMALRGQDTLFRYAGDEFVILLRETVVGDALAVAERVRLAAAGIRFTYRGTQEIRITVSLGVAQAKGKDTPESLFERADRALYEAKRTGRDRAIAAK
jgi:diguanylate cyclase